MIVKYKMFYSYIGIHSIDLIGRTHSRHLHIIYLRINVGVAHHVQARTSQPHFALAASSERKHNAPHMIYIHSTYRGKPQQAENTKSSNNIKDFDKINTTCTRLRKYSVSVARNSRRRTFTPVVNLCTLKDGLRRTL